MNFISNHFVSMISFLYLFFVLETEERSLNLGSIIKKQETKPLILFALELRLNLTTVTSIINTMDLNQPEDLLKNQLLDLYYQLIPITPEEMLNPNILFQSISHKISQFNPSTIMESIPAMDSFSKKKGLQVVVPEKSDKKSEIFAIEIGTPQKNGQQPQPQEEHFTCPICYEDAVTLEKLECTHKFCTACLMDYFRNRINASQVSYFKCPCEECPSFIQDQILEGFLQKEPNLLEKYEKFKLKLDVSNDKTRVFCLKLGCESIIEKEQNSEYGKCGKCGQEVCFQCRNAWHPEEKNCLLAMDAVFQNYLKNISFKKCPKCQQIIEKIDGCNVMTCPNCRFRFCWLCLKEYNDWHFSIFNPNGCFARISDKNNRGKKEVMMGLLLFILKFLCMFVLGVLIYPFLPIICIMVLFTDRKKSNGLQCSRRYWKEICTVVSLGILIGVGYYIVYPIIFVVFFCFLCFCNPHGIL